MKFLVLQHIDIEHPGVFREFMKNDNVHIDTVELDVGEKIPKLDPYDAMIVMGGPMDTWQEEIHPWLVPEKESIYEFACVQKKPYLGLCLGAQLLGEVVGGKVNKMDNPEIGILDINISNHNSIFKGMNNNIKVLQWHSYEVSDLPDSTTLLASSDVCKVQAFHLKGRMDCNFMLSKQMRLYLNGHASQNIRLHSKKLWAQMLLINLHQE